MSDEPKPPRTFRELLALAPRVEIQTTSGVLYARNMVVNDSDHFGRLVDDPGLTDDGQLGRHVLGFLISRDKNSVTQPLGADEVGRLATIDEMAAAVGRAMNLPRREGVDPLAQVGSEVRDQVLSMRKSADSIGKLSGLDDLVNARLSSTFQEIETAATAIADFEAGLTKKADQDLFVPRNSDFKLPVIEPPEFPRHIEQMAENTRAVADLIKNTVLPTWSAQVAQAKASAKMATWVSIASVLIAVMALVASLLVPYDIREREKADGEADRKVDVAARERQEVLLREQLEAVRALRAQLDLQAAPPASSRSSSPGSASKNDQFAR
ncbi:hypothetical protein ACSFA2_00565 [Variovorax sp. LT2P21]|uniref:hypothetical protein n=1 Tax=Variovorax sp. LT2P21 TaxID=3443731 RepID=UPI003F4735A8